MLLVKRAKLDRCSLKERRKNFKLSNFSYRGKERKKSKEWRSQPGRRNRWVRISKWSTEVSEIITDFGRERLTGMGLAICKV